MRLNASSRSIALLCGIVLLSLGSASAQTPRTPSLQGTYTLAEPAASDTIKKAIDKTVKGMFWEGIARRRLEKITLPPYQRIVIQVGLGVVEVSIKTDSREPIRTPLDGRPIEWEREGGEKVKVSTILEGGKTIAADGKPRETFNTLEQTFKTKDGQRVNTYILGADGKTLTMQVRVTGPRLKRPLLYELKYKRAD